MKDNFDWELVFIYDKNLSDTGDYSHIMLLACLTFGHINIEDSPDKANQICCILY